MGAPASDLDVAVVGGGPGGLTAGIYAARAGLKATVFESAVFGGQAASTDLVENYPGFPEPIAGAELAENMRRQAERCGCGLASSGVSGLERAGDGPGAGWTLRTDSGPVSALTVVAASGARPARLGVPGEEKFWGRGISCCATCDGAFFRGREVVVVGGGDTAVKEAAFLTRFASHVTLVHRRDRLRAGHANRERLAAAGGKVTLRLESRVVGILGGEKVSGVRLEHVRTGERAELACEGVFLFVGFLPNSDWLPPEVKRNERGYVLTDEDMATSAPGVFACGDVRSKPFRQIVTACGEGALAAHSAQDHIERLRGTAYE